MSRTDVPNFEERVQFLKRCTVRSRYLLETAGSAGYQEMGAARPGLQDSRSIFSFTRFSYKENALYWIKIGICMRF